MGVQFLKQPEIQVRCQKIVLEVIIECKTQVRGENGQLPEKMQQIVDKYCALGNT